MIATRVKAELAPHCEAISIAGSIRRQVPEVNDIEIVCIPKPYNARPENWGLILAVRTGSTEYSHQVLANRWARRGYKSVNGMLTLNGREIPVYTEQKLFDLIGLPYVRPERRFI